MAIKLSCTANMVPGKTLTEKAHTVRKLGYDGMAIFVDAPDWKDELLDEMLQMEERTGVKPCEFVLTAGYYGHLMNKDPEIRKQALVAYKQSIEIANKIGAITEMEYEYRTQDPLPLFEPYQQMPEEEKELYVSIVNELGACVKPGAAMLIESCNRYETKYMTRLCDCVEMLERADPAVTKNMGLIADFFHLAIEEVDIAQSIIDAGKWIRHVHLGDSNRLAPGYGHTDWKSGFAALKQIGFNGYMNLECGVPGPYDVVLPQVAEFLKKVYENA